MTTIIDQWNSCDGYNVRVNCAGRMRTLHFLSVPTEDSIAEQIDVLEREVITDIETNTVIISEEHE